MIRLKSRIKEFLRTDDVSLDAWRYTTGQLAPSLIKAYRNRFIILSLLRLFKRIFAAIVWMFRIPYQVISFLLELETLHYFPLRNIKKGRGCVIDRQTWLINGQNISLGHFVKISAFSSLMAGRVASISIGTNTIISTCVVIVAFNHGYMSDKIPIRYQKWDDRSDGSILIGENVWIGANVVILPGSQIGNGSIIGAGSIVKGVVPPNSIYLNEHKCIIKPRRIV